MGEPVIVPRAEHPISRKDIDPDALKVLYRLRDFKYTAYLVGGGVRDLMLGRNPKDFDVGTDAHPYQIKKLFRNCWIIGRRFRLAHVRFGTKTIEVATFRRNIPEGDEPATPQPVPADAPRHEHDNTFGTSEEDAFRRDFTINALFYDIGTFSVIDYVGGLDDLRNRVIRSIGDPNRRFQEDPVRMLRAVAFAARLDFSLDPPIVAAMKKQRHLMATASPARLIEEYYKILRSGAAERTFRGLAEHGLLEPITPELQKRSVHPKVWAALEALDDYRLRFVSAPESLTNPVLLGSLIIPIGLMPRGRQADSDVTVADDGTDRNNMPVALANDGTDRNNMPMGFAVPEDEDDDEDAPGNRVAAEESDGTLVRGGRGRWSTKRDRRPKPPVLKIGVLPIARRDSERLRQVLAIQPRLRDMESSPRAKRALMYRSPFNDALTWLEIHGDVPEIVEHWRGFIEAIEAEGGRPPSADAAAGADDADGPRRRRRRGGRRRRGRNRRPRQS